MKISMLGPKGTFCDKAYEEYCKWNQTQTMNPIYEASIEDVFDTVCGNEDILGIVPVENMLDGYVQRTLDLLLEQDVCILDEISVPVQFALVGNATKTEEIKRLYVQFKASGQCREFIHSLKNVDIITTESNMESYYKIGEEAGSVAIVPQHILGNNLYHVLSDNVTDAKKNYTRFLVLRRGALDTTDVQLQEQLEDILNQSANEVEAGLNRKVRIPVYIVPATDRPGILFDILRRFYEKQINLISIMSRPTKQVMGTYNFYIEIDCLYTRLDVVVDTLRQIQVYNDIKILGIYREQEHTK